MIVFDRLTKDSNVDPVEVSKNGRFRDTTTGYLVLWVNHAIYTYGDSVPDFIWLLARNSQLLKYQDLGFKYRPILYAYRLYYFIP